MVGPGELRRHLEANREMWERAEAGGLSKVIDEMDLLAQEPHVAAVRAVYWFAP